MTNQEIALQIFSEVRGMRGDGEKLVFEYIKILDAFEQSFRA